MRRAHHLLPVFALLLAAPAQARVTEVGSSGGHVGTAAVAVDPAGNAWFGQHGARSFRVVTPAGALVRIVPIGDDRFYAHDVAFAPDGDIVVADYASITRLSPAGSQRWSTGAAKYGVAFDAAGRLWATHDSTLVQLDPATGAMLQTTALQSAEGGLSVDRRGGILAFGQDGGARVIERFDGGVRTETLRPPGAAGAAPVELDDGTFVFPTTTGLRLWSATRGVLGDLALPTGAADVATGSGGILWAPRIEGYMQARHLRIDTTPEPVLAAPALASTGETVRLDASATTATLVPVERFEWDLDGDGTFERDTGGSATTEVRWLAPGARVVAVRATNVTGGAATRAATVDVRPASPPGPLGVSINGGAQFTRSADVDVSARWPRFATSLFASNDGGFGTAAELPVAGSFAWRLDASGPERLPKTLYVRFKGGEAGAETYQDDIILDQTPPIVVSVEVDAGRRLQAVAPRRYVVRAEDGASGVAQVDLAETSGGARAQSVPYTGNVVASATTRWLRVRDFAGNTSAWQALPSAAVPSATGPARLTRALAARRGVPLVLRCPSACRALVRAPGASTVRRMLPAGRSRLRLRLRRVRRGTLVVRVRLGTTEHRVRVRIG